MRTAKAIRRALVSVALGLTACTAALAASDSRPNIVVLVADDWGFSDVGAFGSEIATANLDELARRGARFSNFHVSASCSPTRSMLLTGVDNHLNGIGNMRETIPQAHVGRPGYLTVLDTNVVTIATLLHDSGYHTYAAGKWHVGKEPHNLPPQRGFERSFVQGDSGCDNWEPHRRYLALTDKVYWFDDGKTAAMPAEYYSSEFFVDRAIQYISSGATDGKPFFAYVAFQANHIPVQAPRAFVDKYRGVYNDGWNALRRARRDRAAQLDLMPPGSPLVTMSTTRDWDTLPAAQQRYEARRMEVYAGMAEAMDYHIGRLIAHLRKTGAYDNTVFVFLSDNGAEASDPYASWPGRLWLDSQYSRDIDQLGAKGAYTVIGPSWASAAASPLGTYKFYAGEGGIRVPLIIAGVPGMPGNRIHRGLAHVNDIVPTLLDLAHVPRPGTTYTGRTIHAPSGRSLLPVLLGDAERTHAPDEAIGYELSGNQALFKGNLKLLKNLPPVGDGQWHLYDIQDDPGETRDLQLEMPEAFTSMQADYAAYARANGVLDMPAGYEPARQVLINSLVNVYLPRYSNPALALLAALVAMTTLLWRRRRAL